MKAVQLTILAACALGACGSLTSPEQETAADAYWNNARIYYKGRDYARSIDQIEKGLALDPDHYRLLLLKGWVQLQLAPREPRLFEKALESFEAARAQRSDSQHEYTFWLGLGQAHQGLYLSHRRAVERLDRELAEAGLPDDAKREKTAQVKEHLRQYAAHLDEAERFYLRLAQGDDVGAFPAHERLFLLELDRAWRMTGEPRRKQLAKALAQAKDYLGKNAFRQEWYTKMLDISGDVRQERYARRTLRDLKRRERGFRAAYANLLFDLEQYGEAVKELDRVLEIDPTSSAEYYNRARCRLKLGDKRRARLDLEHFIRTTKQPFESPRVTEANRLLREIAKSG